MVTPAEDKVSNDRQLCELGLSDALLLRIFSLIQRQRDFFLPGCLG